MPKAGTFLPRLVNGDKTGELAKTLRFVDPSRPSTLELSHGSFVFLYFNVIYLIHEGNRTPDMEEGGSC